MRELTTITVARGRSITTGIVTGQQMVDGVPQLVYGMHVVEPGETLEVEADEAQRLIASGYAVDPNAPPLEVSRQDGGDPREIRTQG